MTYGARLAPGKNSRCQTCSGMKARYFPGETISYISLANIAVRARDYGTPGMHAYFSAELGTKFLSASRANATFYYERRRRAGARSVEPKRPSASIFCPRQRFFSVSPPLIPRRSSFTGAGTSRCISLVQLFSLYS